MLHEASHTITSPLTAKFQLHVGKPDQRANRTLVNKAASNGFKIQNDYYTAADPYWSAQHRLLDTAYVVGEFTIGVGETSIPELDFVVRGKGIKCYNYDRSYARNNTTSAASSQFNLGDTVDLKKSSNNASIASSVTIIDKWNLIDPEGVSQTRFRTDHNQDITEAHYMEKASEDILLSGIWPPESTDGQLNNTVPIECFVPVTGTSVNGGGGLDITVGTGSAGNPEFFAAYALAVAAGGDAANISISSPTRLEMRANTFNNITFLLGTRKFVGVGTGSSVENLDAFEDSNGTQTAVIHMKNGIAFNSSHRASYMAGVQPNSSFDGFYTGYKVVLKHFDSAGVPNIQERDIIGYNNAANVALVSSPWDHAYLPDNTSKYTISAYKTDLRVSTNPALQLLDYLTSPIYGRGLDLEEDIDLAKLFYSLHVFVILVLLFP